jgi:hypothetical protein
MSQFESLMKNVEKVRSLQNLPEPERARAITDFISGLSIDEVRAYSEYCNYCRRGERKCSPDKGKIIGFEYTPINQEYSYQMAFLGNIQYVVTQANSYPLAKRKVIMEFIEHCYATKEDHIGSIYDLYKPSDPIAIPDLTGEILDKIRPSFETWNNAYMYFKANFESLRAATTAMFGTRPTQESRVYVHGVFDKQSLEDYRINHAENIKDILYTAEVGQETILDPYRDLRNSCIVYHPGDPEVEELLRNKDASSQMQEKVMLNKIRNGNNNYVSAEDMAVIAKYKKSIAQLDTLEQTDSVLEMKENLRKKIEESLNVSNGQVVTRITDMSTGRVKDMVVDRVDLGLV